jgi:hypothetical protein
MKNSIKFNVTNLQGHAGLVEEPSRYLLVEAESNVGIAHELRSSVLGLHHLEGEKFFVKDFFLKGIEKGKFKYLIAVIQISPEGAKLDEILGSVFHLDVRYIC